MNNRVNRRALLQGGLLGGVALAIPAQLMARSKHHAVAEPVASAPAAPAPVADAPLPGPVATPVAAEVNALTPYERRILAVAQRELERNSAVLWRKDLVGVADFAQPSSLPRLHFVDMEAGRLRTRLVAHGRGSDPAHSGWLERFSNTVGSEATSRGAYLTCEWYQGVNGTSIRLRGLDADNSRAAERAIVMHSAWYASPDMLAKWGKLGRSEGCFAMDPEHFQEALWHLSGGRLLFADRIGEA